MLSVFAFYFTFLSPTDSLVNESGDVRDLISILCSTHVNFPRKSLFALELSLFDEMITK